MRIKQVDIRKTQGNQSPPCEEQDYVGDYQAHADEDQDQTGEDQHQAGENQHHAGGSGLSR